MAKGSGDVMLHLGLLLMRVSAAAMLFAAHGWPKITHFPQRAETFANPIGIGSAPSLALVVFAEVFCSLFVALGLFTRFAAAPIVVFFAIAIFLQFAGRPFDQRELAAVYAVPFVTLLFTGPGRFSLDAVTGRVK
jgi:putative oxidoreductase